MICVNDKCHANVIITIIIRIKDCRLPHHGSGLTWPHLIWSAYNGETMWRRTAVWLYRVHWRVYMTPLLSLLQQHHQPYQFLCLISQQQLPSCAGQLPFLGLVGWRRTAWLEVLVVIPQAWPSGTVRQAFPPDSSGSIASALIGRCVSKLISIMCVSSNGPTQWPLIWLGCHGQATLIDRIT